VDSTPRTRTMSSMGSARKTKKRTMTGASLLRETDVVAHVRPLVVSYSHDILHAYIL
jgi:hypothetical protein